MYKKTKLNSLEQRLTWMEKSVNDFEKSKDPFIKLAVASFKERKAIEDSSEELAASIQAFRSKYMEALIAYFNAKKLPVYANANANANITLHYVLLMAT
jgi:hypothetical protein